MEDSRAETAMWCSCGLLQKGCSEKGHWLECWWINDGNGTIVQKHWPTNYMMQQDSSQGVKQHIPQHRAALCVVCVGDETYCIHPSINQWVTCAGRWTLTGVPPSSPIDFLRTHNEANVSLCRGLWNVAFLMYTPQIICASVLRPSCAPTTVNLWQTSPSSWKSLIMADFVMEILGPGMGCRWHRKGGLWRISLVPTCQASVKLGRCLHRDQKDLILISYSIIIPLQPQPVQPGKKNRSMSCHTSRLLRVVKALFLVGWLCFHQALLKVSTWQTYH